MYIFSFFFFLSRELYCELNYHDQKMLLKCLQDFLVMVVQFMVHNLLTCIGFHPGRVELASSQASTASILLFMLLIEEDTLGFD